MSHATPDKVVIVGAGHAGFNAAAALRQGKFAGEIVLLGDEAGLPYHRPPLSKELLTGATDEAGIRLRPAAFYEKARIAYRESVRVVAIDRAACAITTDRGERIAYDHLILAAGARNRALAIPGVDLDGVCALHTRADAIDLKRRLAEARDIVVIGAGFIGLEFAATAVNHARVTILERADRPLARAVSAPISDSVAAAHCRWGTRLLTGVSAAAIEGDAGRVASVTTSENQTIPADLVLIGIGVVPNDELASAACLATGDGIRVDALLTTSDPAISAIGDCAAFPRAFTKSVIRLESVQNATDQARCVANRLVGKPAPYAAVPWFWSDQGTLKLQIVGLTAGYDQAVLRGDPASGAFSVFCFRDDQLIGIESVGRPEDHMAGRRLLAGPCALTPAQAADETFDLRTT